MSLFKRANKRVNLPYRQPSEFERFRAFVKHEEKEKGRIGFETFAEANDFNVPEDPDPLEQYFARPTKHQEVGHFMENIAPQVLNPDGSVKKPTATPTPTLPDKGIQEDSSRSADRMEPAAPVQQSGS